jgi:hypothetical protein
VEDSPRGDGTLADPAHAARADRCLRPAPDRLAESAQRAGLGRAAGHGVGVEERASRTVGLRASRLAQRQDRRAPRLAGEGCARRRGARVDAGHVRHDHGEHGAGRPAAHADPGRHGRLLRAAPRQPQGPRGDDRPAGAAGGLDPSARQAPRRQRRADAVHARPAAGVHAAGRRAGAQGGGRAHRRRGRRAAEPVPGGARGGAAHQRRRARARADPCVQQPHVRRRQSSAHGGDAQRGLRPHRPA